MLTLPSAVRLFVCTQPTDMRRGFDRLALMVEQMVKQTLQRLLTLELAQRT